MKTIIFLALAVTAVIALRNRDESKFVITSINGGRGSGSGSRDTNNDRLTGSGGRNRQQAPDFFRIEVEFVRFDDAKGILSNGKACDLTKQCDPRITVHIDTEKPFSPWPGAVPVSKWTKLIEKDDTNSFSIGKSINRDVCGGAVNRFNARAFVEDVDGVSGNDEIGKFDCKFEIRPQDIAVDPRSAEWSPSTECTVEKQAGQIRLFARQRAYEISSSSCRAAN